MALTVARGSAVERFDPPLELGQHGIALAVECTAGGNLDPAFADAIFADVVEFLVVELDADVVLEDGGNVVRAAGIDAEAVGEGGALCGIVHGRDYRT